MRCLPVLSVLGSLCVGAGLSAAVLLEAPTNELPIVLSALPLAHPAGQEPRADDTASSSESENRAAAAAAQEPAQTPPFAKSNELSQSLSAAPARAAPNQQQAALQPPAPPSSASQAPTQPSPPADVNEPSQSLPAAPGHAQPNEQQAALQPLAPPSSAQPAPVDEQPRASLEFRLAALPRDGVPLPPQRPSPEVVREQSQLAAPLFAKVGLPSAGAPRPVGFYSAGCMAGGEQLALQGPHWQVMRPSRNRYWGQPELIDFIKRLAENVAERTPWPGILVGDMAQPRGGPLPAGHASHQVGLDVDIWLHPMPAKPYSRAEADGVPMLGVTAADNKTLDAKLWQHADAAMIKLAAEDPNVERIFVNAVIKKELCRTKTAADDAWMRKVRPWYGHADHMHVRLKCPADAPECREQTSIAEGDGCGKSLDQWLSKEHLAIEQRLKTQAPTDRHVHMRDLPIACTAILHEPATSRLATGER